MVWRREQREAQRRESVKRREWVREVRKEMCEFVRDCGSCGCFGFDVSIVGF